MAISGLDKRSRRVSLRGSIADDYVRLCDLGEHEAAKKLIVHLLSGADFSVRLSFSKEVIVIWRDSDDPVTVMVPEPISNSEF